MANVVTEARKRDSLINRGAIKFLPIINRIKSDRIINNNSVFGITNTIALANYFKEHDDFVVRNMLDRRLNMQTLQDAGESMFIYNNLQNGDRVANTLTGFNSWLTNNLVVAIGLGITAPQAQNRYIAQRTPAYSKLVSQVETLDVGEKTRLSSTYYKVGGGNSPSAVGGGLATGSNIVLADVSMLKSWSALFHNTRPAHIAANGQIVPINQPFIVGGERLITPGDMSSGASVGNVINCNCSVQYISA